MKIKLLKKIAISFGIAIFITTANAQVGTGFSEPTASSNEYVDANTGTHQLSNLANMPTVEYIYGTNGSTELGFTTKFIATRTGSASNQGLSDGDFIGVITATANTGTNKVSVGSGNVYMIEDPDGTLQIEFDEVDLTGTSSPTLTLKYGFRSTSYEATAGDGNDRFFIGLRVNGASTLISLLDTDGDGTEGGNNITGNDLDDGGLIVEGTEQVFTANLSAYIGSKVSLVIEADLNAGSEEVAIDDILFSEGIRATTNTNPTIALANPTINYTEGTTAIQIDNLGTVNDSDGDADWNGGTLVAQITTNSESTDEISIADTDGDGTAITISGTNILANGTDIGDLSVSGGIVSNNTALTITFDSDATNAIVQEVLQSLRYRNTSSTPSTLNRTITITATDANTGTASDTRIISITTVPDITSVGVPANNTYTSGENLDFTLNYNENITVNTGSGTSGLSITIGTTNYEATYLNGSGTSSLIFRYIVQNGDLDTNGITVNSLSENGGTLQNGNGVNANLTLSNIGNTTSILVDAVNPVAPIVTLPTNAITVNSTVQTISGTHTENGVTIHAYADANNDGTADNTISLASVVVSGNAWSFSVSLTANSANNFIVQAKDNVGNASNNVDVPTITQTSEITWTGATNNNWNTASNWNINSIPTTGSNVTIPNSVTNYPTISSAVTVNSINIASGASLIANASVTGETTYTRNLPTTNWYLVAAPVSGETRQDIIANHTLASGTGGNLGFAQYSNITGPAWLYEQSGSNGSLISGKGYSIKLATPGNVSFTGTVNTTNISTTIAAGSRNNFNLIGNPYTSYINSSNFTAVNTGLLSEETIWLWNGTQYVTHNAVNPIEIAPTQGFFVEASGNGNVIFSTVNQSHKGTDTFMRQTPKSNFELFVEENNKKQATKVFYVAEKTTGFDNGYDSKMFGGVNTGFAIFTQLVSNDMGKKLAIQTLPNANYETMVIPVGLIAKAGKELTISAKAMNLPQGLQIYLEDRKNGVFTNISEENYTFTLNEDANGIGQFYIHTSSKALSTETVTQNLKNVSIYKSSASTLTIAGLQTRKATINMYSMVGKEVFKTNFTSNGVQTVNLPVLASGVYLVKVSSELGNLSKKIIIE